MDRTKLFQELVAQHEQHRGVTARHNPLGHVGSSTTTAGAFTRAAAEVSRDLHSTAAKVQQLTKSLLFFMPWLWDCTFRVCPLHALHG